MLNQVAGNDGFCDSVQRCFDKVSEQLASCWQTTSRRIIELVCVGELLVIRNGLRAIDRAPRDSGMASGGVWDGIKKFLGRKSSSPSDNASISIACEWEMADCAVNADAKNFIFVIDKA